MQYAGSPRQAGKAVRSAAPKTPSKTPSQAPSWRQVLATTLRLWVSRRLRPRWVLLLVICVLAAAAATAGAVRLTSTSAPAAAPAPAVRVSPVPSARPQQARPGRSAGAARPAINPAALQADAAARRSAGAQLLHSQRIVAGAQGSGQLQAGQVDSRLLIMLAMLASQRSWQVIAFGDASPGVPLAEAPFRQVIITGAGGGDQAAGLAAALALLRAQHAPYRPAQVTTVHLADGQAGLRIDFAAPSPLGLLGGGVG